MAIYQGMLGAIETLTDEGFADFVDSKSEDELNRYTAQEIWEQYQALKGGK